MKTNTRAGSLRRKRARRGGLGEPNPRVLVAEDDDELRHIICEALRDDGYEVAQARTGDELLDVLGSFLLGRPDAEPVELIISDVHLPGGVTGLDMLAGLRRADWSTPVVLITGFGDGHVYEEAHRLGAFVIDKPFDVDDLRTAALLLAPPII